MGCKEKYLQNCERVYNIYKIPRKDRGSKYTIHHIIMKSDYKFGLIEDDGKMNDVSNLIPLLRREQHDPLHRRLEALHEDWCSTPKKSKRKFRR